MTATHGVPQGSVLGHTFNIHINGFSEACQNTNVVTYADDTEIRASLKDITLVERCVNQDLINISKWWGKTA